MGAPLCGSPTSHLVIEDEDTCVSPRDCSLVSEIPGGGGLPLSHAVGSPPGPGARAVCTECDRSLLCWFWGSWFRHAPGTLILLQGPSDLEQIKILPCCDFHMGRMKINPAPWAFM